jgi:hypothetical protein
MSARRLEVTSLPRRGRFDAWYEDFPYAPGPLVGNGPWFAAPFAPDYPSLTVRTAAEAGVMGAADETRAATLAVPGVNLARPWSLSFSVAFAAPAPVPGSESYCYILLGDESGAQNAVVVDLNDGSGGADHAQIYLADDQSHLFFQVVPFAFGAPHRVTLTWDGVTHRAFLDGVETVVGTLRDPGTIALKDVSLFIIGDESAARWTIYDFEMRWGTSA